MCQHFISICGKLSTIDSGVVPYHCRKIAHRSIKIWIWPTTKFQSTKCFFQTYSLGSILGSKSSYNQYGYHWEGIDERSGLPSQRLIRALARQALAELKLSSFVGETKFSRRRAALSRVAVVIDHSNGTYLLKGPFVWLKTGLHNGP